MIALTYSVARRLKARRGQRACWRDEPVTLSVQSIGYGFRFFDWSHSLPRRPFLLLCLFLWPQHHLRAAEMSDDLSRVAVFDRRVPELGRAAEMFGFRPGFDNAVARRAGEVRF